MKSDFFIDRPVFSTVISVLIVIVGVIGPTRMKYGEVTSVIEYMTDNLSDTFKLESGGNDKDE